jgi:hypothetical protein
MKELLVVFESNAFKTIESLRKKVLGIAEQNGRV